MLLKVWLFLLSTTGQITSWISRSYDDGTLWIYLAISALIIVVFILRRALYNLNSMWDRFGNLYEEEELKRKTIVKPTDPNLSAADEVIQKLNKLDITVQKMISEIGNINTV